MDIKKDKKYLVRGECSGVFYGNIARQEGREIQMTDARCIWYWEGANSLIQLAKDGPAKPDNCKFTVAIHELTLLDAVEVLECTEKAVKSIDGVREWRF